MVFRAGHGGYTVFKMKLLPSSPPLPPAVAAALAAVASPSSSGKGAGAAADTITVVGGSLLLPSVARVGQPLRVRGKWTTHQRFGGQLAASTEPEGVEAIAFGFGRGRGEGGGEGASSSSSSSSDLEADAEAVANLLAGAKLPGVGPAIARRIVDALGGEFFLFDFLSFISQEKVSSLGGGVGGGWGFGVGGLSFRPLVAR